MTLHRKRGLAANFVKRLLGQGIGWIASFVFLVFAGRMMSEVELALIAAYLIIDAACQTIAGLGVSPSMLKRVPLLLAEGNWNAAAGLLRSGIVVSLVALLLVAVAVLLLSTELSRLFLGTDQHAGVIAFMAPGIVLSGTNAFLAYGMQATQRFGALSLGAGLVVVAQRLCAICLFYPYHLHGIVVGFGVGALLGDVFYLYCLRDFLLSRGAMHPVKELLVYSVPYYAESIVKYLSLQGDQLIVSALLSTADLAAYFIARKLFDVVYMTVNSFGEALIPKMAELSARGVEEVQSRYRSLVRYCSFLFIPISFFWAGLSPWFVRAVGGDKYEGAVWPSVILCGTALVYGFRILMQIGVFVLGRPVDRLKLEASYCVAMLVMGSVFGSLYGVSGVAMSRLLAMVCGLIWGMRAVKRFTRVQCDWGDVVWSGMGSGVMFICLFVPLHASAGLLLVVASAVLGIVTMALVIRTRLKEADLLVLEASTPACCAFLVGLFRTVRLPARYSR